jgi:hypothetical protein
MTLFQKIATAIVAVIAITGYIVWHTMVAIHDRTHPFAFGNTATASDLLKDFQDNGHKDTEIQAKAAYDKGDYDTARKLYRKLTNTGNATAMYYTGLMCAKGQGGPVDNAEALKWFRRSAEEGNRDGQFALGVAYEHGTGIAQDPSEAMKWYQKSAAQGSPGARVNLGALYFGGNGVAQDVVEAQKWFILAGELGQKNRASLDAALTPDQRAAAKQRADEWGSRK